MDLEQLLRSLDPILADRVAASPARDEFWATVGAHLASDLEVARGLRGRTERAVTGEQRRWVAPLRAGESLEQRVATVLLDSDWAGVLAELETVAMLDQPETRGGNDGAG